FVRDDVLGALPDQADLADARRSHALVLATGALVRAHGGRNRGVLDGHATVLRGESRHFRRGLETRASHHVRERPAAVAEVSARRVSEDAAAKTDATPEDSDREKHREKEGAHGARFGCLSLCWLRLRADPG